MLRKMIKKFSEKNSELTKPQLHNIRLFAVITVIIMAAMLMIISGRGGVEHKTTETAVRDETEHRLEEILSHVQGAGEVKVMIVYKDNGRESIAMNTEYSEDEDGSIKSQSTAVLGGDKKAVVVQKKIPEVQGVIVTAQGAGNPTVRENIKKAVEAALPVLSHRIEVLEGE